MTRVILTGTHGSGKTTILNHYKDRLPVVTEIVRSMVKESGIKINEAGDERSQRMIFDAHIKNLSERHDYISDRGPTDAYAYTLYHHIDQHNNIPVSEVMREEKELEKFIKDNPDIIWCYFPIEFAVVDDGVRSTEETFRRKVDEHIHEILDRYNIKYHVISGTVEERIKKIDNLIEDHEKNEKTE